MDGRASSPRERGEGGEGYAPRCREPERSTTRRCGGVGCAIDHGVRASLLHEQFLERDRGAHDVLGQPLVQELALEEERDDSLAQAGAHLDQISSRDVDESALSVKASLQEQAVPVRVPASELS